MKLGMFESKHSALKALDFAFGCGCSWKNGQNCDYLYVWKGVAALGKESNWENGKKIEKRDWVHLNHLMEWINV